MTLLQACVRWAQARGSAAAPRKLILMVMAEGREVNGNRQVLLRTITRESPPDACWPKRVMWASLERKEPAGLAHRHVSLRALVVCDAVSVAMICHTPSFLFHAVEVSPAPGQ